MISVIEDLPANGKLVNIAYRNSNGKELVTTGFYRRKFEVEADFDFDDDFDYHEKKDQYYFKEGWSSCCLESEFSYPISNVSHWQELPKHPLK